jgi:hypothetical protein
MMRFGWGLMGIGVFREKMFVPYQLSILGGMMCVLNASNNQVFDVCCSIVLSLCGGGIQR